MVHAVRELKDAPNPLVDLNVGWYIKGMRGAAAFRRQVNAIDDIEQMKAAINSLI